MLKTTSAGTTIRHFELLRDQRTADETLARYRNKDTELTTTIRAGINRRAKELRESFRCLPGGKD